MKKTSVAFGALFVAALLAGPNLFVSAAWAQIVEGKPYEQLRAELMAKGWKPDVSYGTKLVNGAAVYHYPEIMCGPDICRSKWRDPQGHVQDIMLHRGINRDHTVAAQ